MNIYLKLTALLCLLPFLGQSQVSLGFLVGAANYQGDLAQNFASLNETHFVVGGGLGYRISPKVDFKVQLLRTKLSGDDANYPDRVNRKFRFETKVTELSAMFEYYILGSSERSITGVFEPSYTPFLYGGLGFSNIANVAECYTDDCKNGLKKPFPEENFTPNLFTLPLGVGVKYDASPLMAVGLRAGYRYSFSDYLDGVSVAGNSEKNDWYFVIGTNVTFYLVKKKRM